MSWGSFDCGATEPVDGGDAAAGAVDGDAPEASTPPTEVRIAPVGATPHGEGPLRLARLESFEPACAVAPGAEEEAYRRRFGVLFVDDGSTRRGGLGSVSRAVNARGEEFALKAMLAPARAAGESEGDFEARRRALALAFREEYETHRALSGFKGFPRLYGYAQVDGAPAIIMEWVVGQTLWEARRELAVDGEGRLSPLDAARMGRDLFALLERMGLAGDGVVHRDVSPANVMVRTGRMGLREQAAEGAFDLCLIDFGSSALADAGEGARRPTLTQSGTAVRRATLGYAPPEMLSDDPAGVSRMRRNPLLDVYAAASVVFELACGEGPYARALDARGERSAYRVKMDEGPQAFRGAHAPGCDLEGVIKLEPGVAVAAGRSAVSLGVAPGSEELRRALETVDSQLADLLAPCLEPRQERRPDAASMRAALTAFAERYGENVSRALRGRPLVPCTGAAGWADAAPSLDARRLLPAVGAAASAAVWAVALVTSASLVGGTPAQLRLGGATVASGRPSGLAWALFFALPAAAGYAARGRGGAPSSRFARGTAALACGAFAEALFLAFASLATSELKSGAFATVFALFAAAWCPMVVDFAAHAVPAALAESRRLKAAGRPGAGRSGMVEGGPSGSRAALADAGGEGESSDGAGAAGGVEVDGEEVSG